MRYNLQNPYFLNIVQLDSKRTPLGLDLYLHKILINLPHTLCEGVCTIQCTYIYIKTNPKTLPHTKPEGESYNTKCALPYMEYIDVIYHSDQVV